MTGAPRPQDPALLYASFQKHQAECRVCTDTQACPYGEHLLMAWGDADRFYAEEQRVIDAVIAKDHA